jgi:creatinine amidohydrolase
MLFLGGDTGWVRKELIKEALGDPVSEPGQRALDTQSAANALPHRNNGIKGDARRSTVELGKMALDMKVE